MQQARSALSGLITFALWLVSAALVFLVILVLRDLIVLLYAWGASEPVNPDIQYGSRYWLGLNISNFTTMILGVLGMAFVVGSGEYHYRHWGTSRSWRLLGWSLGTEAVILVLGWFV